MAVVVSLRDVIEQMDLTTDEATAYINRKIPDVLDRIRAYSSKRED